MLKDDGSVRAWGEKKCGGNVARVQQFLKSGVTELFSTRDSFSALKEDGSVVYWGGDCLLPSCFNLPDPVQRVYSNLGAFAALLLGGRVVTWGDNESGGDSSVVAQDLEAIVDVAASDFAFAALTQHGHVITWGDPRFGAVSNEACEHCSQGVKGVTGNQSGFAAVTKDGRIVSWGDVSRTTGKTQRCYCSVTEASDVVHVYGGRFARTGAW